MIAYQPMIGVLDADYFDIVVVEGLLDDRSYYRVYARAVTAAGQHRYAFDLFHPVRPPLRLIL